jgi:lysozyme family protein
MRHSSETVQLWLDRIIGHEGRFTDDRDDPGNWTGGKIGAGELVGTKWGIAANTYGHAVAVSRGLIPIRDLTIEDAAEIYRRDFLSRIKAYEHEDGVAYQLLDFAINSGPVRARYELQDAIGVKADGIVGPVTLSRLSEFSEAQLIMLLLSERIGFLVRLPNWDVAGRGWMRRVAKNLRHGAVDIV